MSSGNNALSTVGPAQSHPKIRDFSTDQLLFDMLWLLRGTKPSLFESRVFINRIRTWVSLQKDSRDNPKALRELHMHFANPDPASRSSLQMDTQLALSGPKTSSFSVRDILDLPEGKSSCSPVQSNTRTVNSVSLSIPCVQEPSELAQAAYYDSNENPYTRWLQTNDTMHYSSEYTRSYNI